MDVKELEMRFSDYCSGRKCEYCKYDGRKTCQMEWAFDEGAKYTFNAAMELIKAFTGYDYGNNKR